MKKKLSPSILAADFNRLGEQIQIVSENGAEYLHIDVMDGFFVPSISFGMPLIKSIRKESSLIFDTHLMIMEPIRYIDDIADCGADIITVHYEACEDLYATIEKIKRRGIKAGISIKPGTSVDKLIPYLGMIDLILVMSVEPGFGGQKFIDDSLRRISDIKALISGMDNPPEIEVDGGINLDNVEAVLDSGTDVIVAGSAVFGKEIAENTKRFIKILKEHES